MTKKTDERVLVRMTNRDVAKAAKEFSNGRYHTYEVLDMLDLLVTTIETNVLSGKEVHIFGLGTFYPRLIKAHKHYTGIAKEYVDVPENVSLAFRPSKAMKTRIKSRKSARTVRAALAELPFKSDLDD